MLTSLSRDLHKTLLEHLGIDDVLSLASASSGLSPQTIDYAIEERCRRCHPLLLLVDAEGKDLAMSGGLECDWCLRRLRKAGRRRPAASGHSREAYLRALLALLFDMYRRAELDLLAQGYEDAFDSLFRLEFGGMVVLSMSVRDLPRPSAMSVMLLELRVPSSLSPVLESADYGGDADCFYRLSVSEHEVVLSLQAPWGGRGLTPGFWEGRLAGLPGVLGVFLEVSDRVSEADGALRLRRARRCVELDEARSLGLPGWERWGGEARFGNDFEGARIVT